MEKKIIWIFTTFFFLGYRVGAVYLKGLRAALILNPELGKWYVHFISYYYNRNNYKTKKQPHNFQTTIHRGGPRGWQYIYIMCMTYMDIILCIMYLIIKKMSRHYLFSPISLIHTQHTEIFWVHSNQFCVFLSFKIRVND